MKTRCGKFGWQAETPAPRWPQWGRRFRLATGAFNRGGAYFNSETGTVNDAVFTTPLRWNCTQIR